jgi:hypothetical protein
MQWCLEGLLPRIAEELKLSIESVGSGDARNCGYLRHLVPWLLKPVVKTLLARMVVVATVMDLLQQPKNY